jgi:hypothetical protein
MKSTCKAIRLTFDELGKPELTLTLDLPHKEAISAANELKAILANNKTLTAEITQTKRKRSLDSNSYAWALIGKIAKAMRPPIPEDEVYIEMLKRYGQREPKLLSVVADAVAMVYRATKNHCCEVGESELNGKLFKHLAILIGSSQYDSSQMSILIDGIVQDAKELEIETRPPEQLAAMNKEWKGREYEQHHPSSSRILLRHIFRHRYHVPVTDK